MSYPSAVQLTQGRKFVVLSHRKGGFIIALDSSFIQIQPEISLKRLTKASYQ